MVRWNMAGAEATLNWQPSELVKSLMRVDGYQLLGILFQRHLLISLS